MKHLQIIALFLVVLVATGQGAVFQDHSFSVSRAGSSVEIVWATASESGVLQFEVHRKTASATDWDVVYTTPPKGAGYQYRWVDETAFKVTDNLYQYFIRAVMSDGNKEDTPIDRTMSSSTSGVRRTWGSIKAMFR